MKDEAKPVVVKTGDDSNISFYVAMGMFDLTAAGISSAILFAFIIALFFKPKS